MEPLAHERLLEAALVVLDEKGRDGMTVEGLLEAAAVSADEFAAAYESLDACLADAYGGLLARLDAAVRGGCETPGGIVRGDEHAWSLRVRGGLEALLAELADHPTLARSLTSSYPALGPAEQMRYQRFLEGLARHLRAGWEASGLGAELPGEVEILAVGGAEAVLVDEIRAGRARDVTALGPEILFTLLVPFVGATHAKEELERARRRR
jgi:hypothetical protein